MRDRQTQREGAGSPPWAPRDLAIAALVFGAAALFRAVAVSGLDGLPAHFAPDEPLYRELARALGEARPDPRFQFVSPLYPLWLWAAGSARALTWIQLGLGATIPAAIFVALRGSGASRFPSLVGAALVLLHAPLLAFETALLPIAPALAALAWALVAGAPLEPGARPGTADTVSFARAFGCGALLALAVGCAPALLPIPLLWSALVFWRYRGTAGGLRLATGVLAPLVVVLAALTVSNALRGLPVSPLGANSGITLAHGNLPGATGTYRRLPGSDASKRNQHSHARAAAERALGRSLSWSQVDRYWRGEAIAAALASPGAAALRTGQKLERFALQPFVGEEIGLAAVRERWSWLYALPVSSVLLVVAGAAGLWRERRRAIGPLAIAAGTLATCLIFYVSDRYRLPAAIGLAGPAGLALWSWSARRPAAIGAALLVAATVAQQALERPSDEQRVFGAARVAQAQEAAGEPLRAADTWLAIHRETPTLESWRGRARSLLNAGRGSEALEWLEEARRAHPGDGRLANDLGVALLRSDRRTEALLAFRAAARATPPVVEAVLNLAIQLEANESYEEAGWHFEEYSRLPPEDPAGYLGAARVAGKRGDDERRARWLGAARRAGVAR